MKSKIKSAAKHRAAGLIEDMMGAASLFVLLFVGLGFSGPY